MTDLGVIMCIGLNAAFVLLALQRVENVLKEIRDRLPEVEEEKP